MNDAAIEVIDLRKSFHGRPALNGLSRRIPVGSIWGFLGRNGAGKTTTIKLLMGLLKPDSGTARVLGVTLSSMANVAEVRRSIVELAKTTHALRRLATMTLNAMTNMDLAKTVIQKLTPAECAELQYWLNRSTITISHLKADLEAGKIDALLKRAIADHKASRTQPL